MSAEADTARFPETHPEITQLLRVADPSQQPSSARSEFVAGDTSARKNRDPYLRKPPCVSSRDRLGVPANGSGGAVPYNTKQSRRWTPHSLTILVRRIPHPYGRPRRGHRRAMSARLVCICENSPHGQLSAVGGPAAPRSAPEHPELHRAGTLPIPRIDSYRAAPSEERVLADRDFTQGALFVETRIDGSHLPIQTGRRSTEPLWHRSRRGAKLFRQPRGVGNNHRKRGETSRGSVALNH